MKTIILVGLFLLGCTILKSQERPYDWLEGAWSITTSRGVIIESWRQGADSTLVGESYFIRNTKDTVPQETITITYRDSTWYYVPVAVGQNDGKAVYFKIIWQRGQEFIAENQMHDFPQRIAYRRIDTQLYASIEGRKNGTYRKQNFDYQRVK